MNQVYIFLAVKYLLFCKQHQKNVNLIHNIYKRRHVYLYNYEILKFQNMGPLFIE